MVDKLKLDWITLASEADYLYRSPNIKGGMIYSSEGNKVCDLVNKIIREEYESEGFSIWSFSNRVSRKDLDIISESISNEMDSSFNNSVHWIFRNHDLSRVNVIKEALRPSGESQIYPFWANFINSYRQLPDVGRIMLQQRFFRVPQKGHRSTTRLESDVSEGHALFETLDEANLAMNRYLIVCESIADLVGIPYVSVESPIWDNSHFNERSSYLCSIMDDSVRLFASAYNQGTNLSEKFGIKYNDKNGRMMVPHIADWGIGLFYPALWHNRDKNGFSLPFSITPFDIQLISINNNPETLIYAEKISNLLLNSGYRVKFEPSSDLIKLRKSWELKGYPIRLEVGPIEISDKSCSIWHRWDVDNNYSPDVLQLNNLLDHLSASKQSQKKYLLAKNIEIKNNKIISTYNVDDLKNAVFNGYIGSFNWCNSRSCIEKLYGSKDSITNKRVGGFVSIGKFLGWDFHKTESEKCVLCGSNSQKIGYWSRRRYI